MARCTFTRAARSITVDAPADRSWMAAATGSHGSATIDLPLGSAAASGLYLDPDGGSLVQIGSDGGCGAWSGVVLGIEQDGRTLRVGAVQPWAILARRIVQRTNLLRNVTVGYVAHLALLDALAGVGPLQYQDTANEAGHNVSAIQFSRDNAMSVLGDLMSIGDAELHVDAETGRVTFPGPLAAATRYDTLLIAGGNLQDARYGSDASGRVAEATATHGDTWFTARRGDSAADGWPSQITVSAEDAGQVAPAAAQALDQASRSTVVIEGAVTEAHWAIRERQYARVLVPWAVYEDGTFGQTHTCRVLGRSLRDGSPLMRLQLHVMQPPLTTSVSSGAGARQAPPQRASTIVTTPPAPGAPVATPRGGGSYAQRRAQETNSIKAIYRVGSLSEWKRSVRDG